MLLHIAQVKKEGKKNRWGQKKLRFAKFDIMVLSECSIKSKIVKIFINEKLFEE